MFDVGEDPVAELEFIGEVDSILVTPGDASAHYEVAEALKIVVTHQPIIAETSGNI